MSKYSLVGETRTLLGKQVTSIRSEGFVPATVYGKTTTPLSIKVNTADFKKMFAQAGETGLIELTIDKTVHPVLIHKVQVHPVTRQVLHVEFHQVDLKEKVHADIPVELSGEPIAVKEKLGVLLTLIDHIEVEALPGNLPEKLVLDVTSLAQVGDQITVETLSIPEDVTVLTDKEIIIAKIGAFIVEKEPEVVAPTTETAAPGAEGETTTEETPTETKEEKKTE